MRRRLCRPRIVLPVVVVLWLLWLLQPDNGENEESACDVGDKTRQAAIALGAKVSEILSHQLITHFLCYSSLWGALRHNMLLPWERKVVLCAMNEDISQLDELFFQRQFSAVGLTLHYRPSLGVYTVTAKTPSSENVWVEVVLFETDDREQLDAQQPQLASVYVRRIGWSHRILPPGSAALHSFPKRLIDPPLSIMQIGNTPFPAPREGLELQKYHFADDWWHEVRPAHCDLKKPTAAAVAKPNTKNLELPKIIDAI